MLTRTPDPGTLRGMKTLNVDSLTNSALMAVAKVLAQNDISIYEVDPNGMTRNALRGLIATFVADKHFALAAADMAESEAKAKSARAHLAKGTALRKAA